MLLECSYVASLLFHVLERKWDVQRIPLSKAEIGNFLFCCRGASGMFSMTVVWLSSRLLCNSMKVADIFLHHRNQLLT